MKAVKQSVAQGVEIPKAIRGALLLHGLDIGGFADKYALMRQNTSQAINGTMRASDAMVAGLIAELGGTEAEWRELLWLAGKPEHVEPVRSAS
jgi:hypothetical protein